MRGRATAVGHPDSGPRPLGLFDRDADGARAEAIAKRGREVNARIGRSVLRGAATLPLADLHRDPADAFDIGDVRGKICF